MSHERPYVVVLAGGEGNRLASLTRALYGHDLPKQFAVLSGDRSLLQTTVERAALLTTLDRVLVVVTAHHAATSRAQLAPYPGVELVVQPQSRDTAAGMMLPLVQILARAANARVVFLPSDHYISDPRPIIAALRDTSRGAANDRVAMIGVAPTSPEVEYGWIVRGDRIDGETYAIARFAEKPPQAIADDMFARGGLWNTFIQVGPAHAFWRLARRHLPHHAELLERYAAAIGTAGEAEALASAYERLPAASFSRDVLAHAEEDLAVLPVAGSGWSDWGTPRRVFASLAGTASHARLVHRIRGNVAFAG